MNTHKQYSKMVTIMIGSFLGIMIVTVILISCNQQSKADNTPSASSFRLQLIEHHNLDSEGYDWNEIYRDNSTGTEITVFHRWNGNSATITSTILNKPTNNDNDVVNSTILQSLQSLQDQIDSLKNMKLKSKTMYRYRAKEIDPNKLQDPDTGINNDEG